MFIKFSTQKTRYESGQIFPFLIAIITVVIIMVMITVNLGQLALYRTDVSNAADAGALAGASVMSGQLLSYGLTSDLMCGENLIKCAAMVLAIVIDPTFTASLPICFAILTTMLSSNISKLWKASLDSQMAWTNARKTAMQYAFNNIGVDEPRPTYEEFLEAIGEAPSIAPPMPDGSPGGNYGEYMRGDSARAREYARNGFARFMDDSKNGWWVDNAFGSVESGPNAPVPVPLAINGYGWQRDSRTGKIVNSYDDSGGNQEACLNSSCWENYENYVEVGVRSRLMYAFELVNLGAAQTALAWAVFAYVFAIKYVWWLAIFAAGPLIIIAPLLAGAFAAAQAMIAKLLIEAVAFGIGFPDDQEYIEDSPVEVRVARHRAGENVGLWNFRYGDRIQAVAQGHCFREVRSGDHSTTIEPTMKELLWSILLFLLVNQGIGIIYFITNWDGMFETSRHLFEVKLKEVK